MVVMGWSGWLDWAAKMAERSAQSPDGGILLVGTHDFCPSGKEQCSSHTETAVGRIAVGRGMDGCLDKVLFGCRQFFRLAEADLDADVYCLHI